MSDRETPPSAAPTRARAAVVALAGVLVALVVLGWLQSRFDYLYDGDSYFHVRASQQLGERGVERTFPQAAYSTWSERYSDKDLLFHVLLVPLLGSGGDASELVAAGKRAALLLDALVLGAMALALLGLRIRFVPLWIALLPLAHLTLQQYFLPVRPHLLSNALFFLEIWALLKRRWVPLLALSALHTWAHSSFVLLPALAAAQIAACALARERPPWQPLAAIISGIGAATLLHPYFPNNATLAWDQLVEVALAAWGLRGDVPQDLFGSELGPIPLAYLVGSFPGWLPALAGLVPFAGRGRRRLSTRALTLALSAAGFLFLSFLSSRFYPLFLSLALLLAGVLWTELAAGRSWRVLWRERRRGLVAGLGVLGGCLAAGAWFWSPLRLASLLPVQTNEIVFEEAVRYLDRAAEPGDVVYHNFWWSFAGLYFFRPDGRYTVALDPIFLYRHDRRLFERMLAAYRGRADDVYEVIAGDFAARWVFVARLPKNQPFRDLLRDEPRIALRHADAYAEVYEVRR